MALFYCIDIILIYTVTCANQGSIDASVLQQPDMSVLVKLLNHNGEKVFIHSVFWPVWVDNFSDTLYC